MYTNFQINPYVKVIDLLKSNRSKYFSIQEISQKLKLNKSVIAQQIKKIRSLGYEVFYHPSKGFKLARLSDLLLPWEVADGLKTNSLGKKIYFFDKIDSTQNFAQKLSSSQDEDGTLIIARKQTQGRGRLKRRWISPEGGIWMSFILNPKFGVSDSTFIPILTSVALAVSIEKVLKIKPLIKWPNDLLVNKKKVAGILMEASIESEKMDRLIIGIGINFNISVREVEKKIKDKEMHLNVGSLVRTKSIVKPVKLVQSFLFEFEKRNEIFSNGRRKEIAKEWTRRSSILGKQVAIKSTNGTIRGFASKLEENGALVLIRRGKKQLIVAGDVC